MLAQEMEPGGPELPVFPSSSTILQEMRAGDGTSHPTTKVKAAARKAGIFNPHHGSSGSGPEASGRPNRSFTMSEELAAVSGKHS